MRSPTSSNSVSGGASLAQAIDFAGFTLVDTVWVENVVPILS
jgi:hypothetical protein